jgi:hypothetical protein
MSSAQTVGLTLECVLEPDGGGSGRISKAADRKCSASGIPDAHALPRVIRKASNREKLSQGLGCRRLLRSAAAPEVDRATASWRHE